MPKIRDKIHWKLLDNSGKIIAPVPLFKLCLTHIFLNNRESIACLGLSVVTKLNTYLGWWESRAQANLAKL